MINIKGIKPSSEHHNERKKDYSYVRKDLKKDNEHWKDDSVASRRKKINALCKDLTDRKLQKNAIPIREAVVLINPHHTLEDLHVLKDAIKKTFNIECFQIHIHKDEGHWDDKENKIGWNSNLHAHMVLDWQDKKTGKTLKTNRVMFSQLQTLVSETLLMERGRYSANSDVGEITRLEPIEFKVQQEQEKMRLLQEQNADLEQKKNEVRARMEKLTEGGNETHRRTISEKAENPSTSLEEFAEWSENDLNSAIKHLESKVSILDK
jgi:hypothetical protein